MAVSSSVSLENVLLDVKELQRGMDLTKREYTMHDHNTLLKEFLLNNEGKLKKLQDDAKIAQVSVCALAAHQEVTGTCPGSVGRSSSLLQVEFLRHS